MRRATACAVLLLAGCASSGETSDNLPGDYGQIIATETDCDQLQDIFDTAETAGLTDVMEAADEKMGEVGCY